MEGSNCNYKNMGKVFKLKNSCITRFYFFQCMDFYVCMYEDIAKETERKREKKIMYECVRSTSKYVCIYVCVFV